jgi:hypothetical protein
MRKSATVFHSSQQGVEIRKPIHEGSVILGLEAVFGIRIEGENQ